MRPFMCSSSSRDDLVEPTDVLCLSEIDGLTDMLNKHVQDCNVTGMTIQQALNDPGALPLLAKAEVVVADPPTFATVADRCESLKWFQSTFAGVDALFKAERRDYTATRLSGVFGPAMSEYVMMHVLALERGYATNVNRQRRKEWGTRSRVAQASYRTLDRCTLGVIGLGDIGSRVAKVASSFGMRVVGCRNTVSAVPEGVEIVWPLEEVGSLLEESDYVVNLLPSTPQTRGLLGGGTLSAAKRGAVLINVGRGDVVDEASIIEALDAGHISHAVLDVFVSEPLPPDSPLWSHPGVTVTPHHSAESFPDDVVRVFAENLKLYRTGEALKHVLSWERGY